MKPASGRPTLAAASVVPRPVTPAEVAQARVFESLLQVESAELHDLAHNDRSVPSWDLVQIRARLDEVQGLLQALRGRFPQLPHAEH